MRGKTGDGPAAPVRPRAANGVGLKRWKGRKGGQRRDNPAPAPRDPGNAGATMERMFMLRGRAVARLLEIRNELASHGGDAASPRTTLASLEQLLFDLRAGRVDNFVLPAQVPIHVFVTDD